MPSSRGVLVGAACLLFGFAPTTPSRQMLADLQVTPQSEDGQFHVWPEHTSTGGLVRVNGVSITNAGPDDAASFTVGLYLSADAAIGTADTRVATITYAGLQSGSRVSWNPGEVTIPPAVPPGSYVVGVLVDETNTVNEADEGNNQAVTAAPLQVHAPVNADLRPGGVIIVIGDHVFSSTALAAPGARISLFNWSVSNLGSQAAPPFTVEFYISSDNQITRTDRRVGARVVNGLAAGAIHQSLMFDFTFRIPANLAAGQYFLGIIVDPAQQVTELAIGREGNNTSASPFQIVTAPSDTTPVWRVQVRVTTEGPTNAGTNDPVYVSLNPRHQMLVDYARNDFERHDAHTYDVILDGIGTLGDIHFLKMAKEGTDGWCFQRVQLMVNERTVYDNNVAPSCRWHDRSPRDSTLFTYADLRGAAQWQAYSDNIPTVMWERDLESIVEAMVGNVLTSQNLYWGTGGGVAVSYVSSNSVHYDIQFNAYSAGPDPTVKLGFDLSVTCFCGDVSLDVGSIVAVVSTAWYPGVIKDYIAKQITDSLGRVADQFGRSFDLGVPLCPIITVFAPPGLRIRFDLPPITQDLAIDATVVPSTSTPGAAVVLTSTVINLGNRNSNPFSTDVYLATATGQPPTLAEMITTGTRLAGSANRPAVAACGTPTTWTETLQLPAGLPCSAGVSGAGTGGIPGFPLSRMPSRDLLRPALGRQYWLVPALTSVGEPTGAGPNASIVPLRISLPDVSLSLRSPSIQIVGGRRLVINGGWVENRGAFTTDALLYRIFLAPATGTGARVLLAQGNLDPLPGGARWTWPGGRQLAIDPSVPPGRYIATIEVVQRGGGVECDLANNAQTAFVEVN